MKSKNVGFGLDRTEKGITLVALVLTIIIMLILAGISFSIVMGENGILDKAIKARNVQNLSVAEEQIALTVADYGQEYYSRIYKTMDLEDDNGVCAYIAERLNGEFDDYTFSTENKMVTVKKDNETQAVGVILEDGSIGWNGKSAFGPANPTYIADFGKKVIGYTGYTAYNENDEWRLFYADNYCVYLIKNSIGSKALNDSTLFPNFNSATISQLGKNLNSKC